MTELRLIHSHTRQRLLDEFQRDLPLVSHPYATIAAQLGISEAQVISELESLSKAGVISRVGPVFTPNRLGSSTLAALAVPPQQLEEVAELVNSYEAVNHNYEREHHYNLWFVVTAERRTDINAVLTDISARTGLEPLDLPMVEDYYIDLGFRLWPRGEVSTKRSPHSAPVMQADKPAEPLEAALAQLLVEAIQQGLPLVKRPYAEIGRRIGLDEEQVISTLRQMLQQGLIKRLGVIVRHHELGYQSNAMVVWDVPDDMIREVGRSFASYTFVTLCYQRPRRLPQWRYNLFTMIHGQNRDEVLACMDELATLYGMPGIPHQPLFSKRRFKQRGAHYTHTKQQERQKDHLSAPDYGETLS
jgi:DNA-binding Lrp family transcriptional regulator